MISSLLGQVDGGSRPSPAEKKRHGGGGGEHGQRAWVCGVVDVMVLSSKSGKVESVDHEGDRWLPVERRKEEAAP